MAQPRSENRFNPLDFEADVAIGLGLPLVHPNAGKFNSPASSSLDGGDSEVGLTKMSGGVFNSTYTTKDQVKANIKNLVLTNPGERYYHPTFGVGVQDLLFENITKELLKNLISKIESQVSLWLPYVTIKDIDIDTSGVDSNKVKIKIDYIIFENDFDLQSIIVFT
jgi:phage baseplate assembly protein W